MYLGFRYVGLKESLRYGVPSSPISSNLLFHNADNALYGFQIGLDGPLWDNHCRLRVDGLAKAGVYLNDVEVSSAQNAAGSGQNFIALIF